MTQNKGPDPSSKAKDTRRQSAALDRRKAALKANMARRKDQARARQALVGAAEDGAAQDESGQSPSDG